MNRRITIKLDSKKASEVLESLDLENAEITVDMEDCGATYKKLSSIDGILDWEFEDEQRAVKKKGVEAGGSTEDASILFEALFALKLNHPTRSFESLSEEDLEEQIQFISGQATNFNHLAVKTVIEKEYSSAEEAKEKIIELYKREWDTVLSYGTILGFIYHLYNKKG